MRTRRAHDEAREVHARNGALFVARVARGLREAVDDGCQSVT